MSKKYWLHRVSHEWRISYALLKKGYLTIGWSKFMQEGLLEAVQKGGIRAFEAFMTSQFWINPLTKHFLLMNVELIT